MARALLLALLFCGCTREAVSGQDASALTDGALTDGPTLDLNPCPSYYLNSGVCPKPGLVCRYFEAVCYCDSGDGMWFCCGSSGQVKCPPPASVPPKTGGMCNEINDVQPCRFSCINGMTTSCSCVGCRWQCTTAACAPDGGTDGG